MSARTVEAAHAAGSIPSSFDELSPAWLTSALRSGSSPGLPAVRAARIERIGEGAGFLGAIARIRLEYDSDHRAGHRAEHDTHRDSGRDSAVDPAPAPAPSSVIVKLPTLVAENRRLGELLGLYWREILFYRELAAQVPIRTPFVHHTALTEDPMRVRRNAIVRVMDKLPAFLVDAMMKRARGIVGASPHRYVLVIEDLATLRVGDQLGGAAPEDCVAVLEAAAGLHARFWGRPELARHGWLSDPDATPRIRHRMYLESRESLMNHYGDVLGTDGRRWIEFVDRHGVSIAKRVRRDTTPTLVHGDLRLDNVFFDDARVESRVVVCDWQLVGRGAAAHDVAYLLSGALGVDTSLEVERELLERYHGALRGAGVSAYGFDTFVRDYRRGLLAAFQTLCSPGDMDLGASRGDTLMRLWIARTLARLRGLSNPAFD